MYASRVYINFHLPYPTRSVSMGVFFRGIRGRVCVLGESRAGERKVDMCGD